MFLIGDNIDSCQMQTILPQLCLYNLIISTQVILNSLVCNIMYKVKTKARQGDKDLVLAAGFVLQ